MDKISRFTIRTSDRRVFRRCLRKWDFMSSLKQNWQREGNETNINFWFGSAIHFALEDFHGWNRYGDPRRAFQAYYDASDKAGELPDSAMFMYPIGVGMLSYYLQWYPKHNTELEFETVWFNPKTRKEAEPWSENAVPGTEIQFFLDLSIKVIVDKKTGKIIKKYTSDQTDKLIPVYSLGMTEIEYHQMDCGDHSIEVDLVPIHYHGTVDRVVKDKYGRWWILDYKTAKSADTNKLDTDDQISAYIWSMQQYLDHPIEGFVYLQLTKDVARLPRRLKNGALSTDKKQKTTHQLVRQEIIKDYGAVANAPDKLIDFLNILAEMEFPEGDRFIRWDLVKRTRNQIINTYGHIMGELEQMLNPNLHLYPNPTRDCIWDCPIREICLAMDDNREFDIQEAMRVYVQRPRGEDGAQEEWKKYLEYPDKPMGIGTEEEFALGAEEDDEPMTIIFNEGSDVDERD